MLAADELVGGLPQVRVRDHERGLDALAVLEHDARDPAVLDRELSRFAREVAPLV